MGGEGRLEGSYSPVAVVYENSARQSAIISDLQNTFFRAAFVAIWPALDVLFSRNVKRCLGSH